MYIHTYTYIYIYAYLIYIWEGGTGWHGGTGWQDQTLRTNTGWRRLIGSPKLQIIFHKRAAKYWSLLRKMTYKDKGSYESSPPYTT